MAQAHQASDPASCTTTAPCGSVSPVTRPVSPGETWTAAGPAAVENVAGKMPVLITVERNRPVSAALVADVVMAP